MANGQQILDTTGQVPFWVANLEGYVGRVGRERARRR